MLLVAKERSRVGGVPKVVAVGALHVHWRSAQIVALALCREPLEELPRHQPLAVTHSNDLGSLDPLDCRRVSVRDLAASDDGNFKQCVAAPGSSGSNGSVPPPSAPSVSTRGA